MFHIPPNFLLFVVLHLVVLSIYASQYPLCEVESFVCVNETSSFQDVQRAVDQVTPSNPKIRFVLLLHNITIDPTFPTVEINAGHRPGEHDSPIFIRAYPNTSVFIIDNATESKTCAFDVRQTRWGFQKLNFISNRRKVICVHLLEDFETTILSNYFTTEQLASPEKRTEQFSRQFIHLSPQDILSSVFVHVENNTFTSLMSGVSVIGVACSSPNVTRPETHLLIQNNEFSALSVGISVRSVSDLIVDQNVFYDNTVDVWVSTKSFAEIRVTSNTFTRNSKFDFNLNNSTVWITNNRFHMFDISGLHGTWVKSIEENQRSNFYVISNFYHFVMRKVPSSGFGFYGSFDQIMFLNNFVNVQDGLGGNVENFQVMEFIDVDVSQHVVFENNFVYFLKNVIMKYLMEFRLHPSSYFGNVYFRNNIVYNCTTNFEFFKNFSIVSKIIFRHNIVDKKIAAGKLDFSGYANVEASNTNLVNLDEKLFRYGDIPIPYLLLTGEYSVPRTTFTTDLDYDGNLRPETQTQVAPMFFSCVHFGLRVVEKDGGCGCMNHFTNFPECDVCPWKNMGPNCSSCLNEYYDYEQNCTVCLGNRNISKNCLNCSDGYVPVFEGSVECREMRRPIPFIILAVLGIIFLSGVVTFSAIVIGILVIHYTFKYLARQRERNYSQEGFDDIQSYGVEVHPEQQIIQKRKKIPPVSRKYLEMDEFQLLSNEEIILIDEQIQQQSLAKKDVQEIIELTTDSGDSFSEGGSGMEGSLKAKLKGDESDIAPGLALKGTQEQKVRDSSEKSTESE